MVKLNKIYTRTGDDGTTGLVDGSRRAKHDARMAAIGEVDEANSALGLAALVVPADVCAELTRIQNDLFDLGADLATPGEDFAPGEMTCAWCRGRSPGWKARSTPAPRCRP
jgi:cob(I)alamin adenosyltransferase